MKYPIRPGKWSRPFAVQPALDGTVPSAPQLSRPQVEGYEAWIAAVRPAFERAAAAEDRWTAYQVADREQLPEPPDPAHHWGQLLRVLRADGVAEPAGWACSPRPTVHASAVRTWRGTREWRTVAASERGVVG